MIAGGALGPWLTSSIFCPRTTTIAHQQSSALWYVTCCLLHLSLLLPPQKYPPCVSAVSPKVQDVRQPRVHAAVHPPSSPGLRGMLGALAHAWPLASLSQGFFSSGRGYLAHIAFLGVCLYFACFEFSPSTSHQGTPAAVPFSHSPSGKDTGIKVMKMWPWFSPAFWAHCYSGETELSLAACKFNCEAF